MEDVLLKLGQVLSDRRSESAGSSYVASLYQAGLDKILKKLGEEAAETIIAAKNGTVEPLVHEVADLWFHSLVLLAYMDLGPDAVLAELERRFGRSGLEEKAARPQGPA